jgi:hypothetical protein
MTSLQYPIHIPIPQRRCSSPPNRPVSVSTNSTLGSPFSSSPVSSLYFDIPSQPEVLTTPVFPALLDATLPLSAREIKSEFLLRDQIFARLVISILAGRIEMGLLSPVNGIGFPFTDNDVNKVKLFI